MKFQGPSAQLQINHKFQTPNYRRFGILNFDHRDLFRNCELEIGNSRRGFTLIEILVSISVVVILAAIMWMGLSSFRESYELDQSADAILALLKDARTRTLASDGATQYGVHFEETKVVLFSGASYNPAGAIDTFQLPSSIRISSVNLAGGGRDTVFARLSGATTQSGTIVLESLRRGFIKNIEILNSGLAEAQ
jgi:prepilin-type N-terminal cleavage/methylation domain-containing protein